MLSNEEYQFKTRGASGMTSLLRRKTSNLVIGICCLTLDLKISKENLPLVGSL
jgi:hypothetical protein